MITPGVFVIALVLTASAVLAQPQFTDNTGLLFTQQFYSEHPIVVSDINRDGLDDLVRSEEGQTLIIDYQQPNGTFTEVDAGAIENTDEDGIIAMCSGDLDENGIMDMVAGGEYDSIKTMLANSSGIEFSQSVAVPQPIFMQSLTTLDLDNDGDLDIIASHDDGPSQVLINDGSGSFTEDYSVVDTDLFPTDEKDAGNYGITCTRINDDNLPDIYISKCRQGVTDPTDVRRINQLFMSTPSGEYQEVAADYGLNDPGQSWSSTFGDIDNDGDMDLFVCNHDQISRLFRNQGDTAFIDVSYEVGLGGEIDIYAIETKFVDFDNDGYLDLLVSGGGEERLCMNDGSGLSFTIYSQIWPLDVNSFGLGDLNDDGFIDIYATPGGYGSYLTDDSLDVLYFNDGNENNYITANLEGVESNLNAIGARVMLYGSWGVQVREVRAGESYGIQNSLKAHFGLGTAQTADSLVISWPSGLVESYYELQAGDDLSLTEGDGLSGISNPRGTQQGVMVYPNPAGGPVTAVLNGKFKPGAHLRVYTLDGRLMMTRKVNHASAFKLGHQLPEGEYILNVMDEGVTRASSRFLVVR